MGITLVQGDTGPQIKVTLTRSDTGSAEDLTGATIKLHFRKKDTTTSLFSLTNQSTGDNLTTGFVSLSLQQDSLILKLDITRVKLRLYLAAERARQYTKSLISI